MIIILLLMVVLILMTSLWAIWDATQRPRDDFVAIGSSKGLWIGLIAFFTVTSGLVGIHLGARLPALYATADGQHESSRRVNH